MKLVAALVGLFMVGIGGFGLASPPRLIQAVARFQSRRGLFVLAAIRVTCGIAVVLAAEGSRAPGVLLGFGIFVLVAGLVTPLFGVRRFAVLLGWWARQPGLLQRGWCLVTLALGLAVIWLVLA